MADLLISPSEKKTVEALWRLEKVILDTLDFKEVVQKCVDSILTELGYLNLGYKIIVLALVDEKQQVLKRVSFSQTEEAHKAFESLSLPLEKIIIPLNAVNNLGIQTLLSQKPAITHNVADVLSPPFTTEEVAIIQQAVGIKSTMIYPLITKGKSTGIIIFSLTKEIIEVTDEEKELIASFTDIVGLAVQNSQLYTKETDSNKALSLLRKIDEVILNSVTDINQISSQVVNTITQDTDFKLAAVYLLKKVENTISRLAISSSDSIIKEQIAKNKILSQTEIPLLYHENKLVELMNRREIQTIHSIYDIVRPYTTQDEADALQATISINICFIYPLIVRGEIIGALLIGTDKTEEQLTSSQHDLLDRLVGVIGIAIDNSLLYQKIQYANERLKQLDKLKDEFVSIASHELRTPMTAVKSYLWMFLEDAKKGVHEQTDLHYLERAYDSVDRLIKLVNDMLNVSRIEGGRLVLNKKAIDLMQVAQDTIAELLPFAQHQKISLILASQEKKIPYVEADLDKIKEVLINLIGNSLKFTPEGGKIVISFVIDNGMVVTKVSDNGKGMSKEDLQKLFQKFAQVGDAATQNKEFEGTGLGLYISKSIVELHGGRMWVDSVENQGTTFFFSLKISDLYTSLQLQI